MPRGGADPGIVHARESWSDEAGVGHMSIKGGGVHGVEPCVLVVLSEHVQALPFIQVSHSTSPILFPVVGFGRCVVWMGGAGQPLSPACVGRCSLLIQNLDRIRIMSGQCHKVLERILLALL